MPKRPSCEPHRLQVLCHVQTSQQLGPKWTLWILWRWNAMQCDVLGELWASLMALSRIQSIQLLWLLKWLAFRFIEWFLIWISPFGMKDSQHKLPHPSTSINGAVELQIISMNLHYRILAFAEYPRTRRWQESLDLHAENLAASQATARLKYKRMWGDRNWQACQDASGNRKGD